VSLSHRRLLLVCTAAALVVGAGDARAQFGFGQNKIQYRGFDWRVLRGEHVDLYHYPEADELARVTLAYAEESYAVLERRLAHAPARRIPIIIYASHTDFEQTNILPFVPPEGLLGVTEFLKRRVALPFRGNYSEFRHTIRHELVHVFQLSLAEEMATRYPKLRMWGLPLWWTEGMAEYLSAGEDTRDEMVLRDLTLSGRLPGLAELSLWYGGVVYPLGGAIHRFLAETYGEWRILQMYRERWKYESFTVAFAAVYGRSLDRVSEEWQHWMRQRYYPVVTDSRPLSITAVNLAELAIKPVGYRPAGDSVSEVLYFSPTRGYAEIHARPVSRSGSRGRTVVKGERNEQFESFHFFSSRLDVSTQGLVAFSSRYYDRDALFLWSLEKSEVVGRYQFEGIVSVLSPSWSPDGRSIVFSGLSITGYSDLYRVTFPDGTLERLTRDRYEDLDPTFSPDGESIVFASDRTPFGPDGAHNLFRLHLATGAIDYLTYGPWNDETPRWSPDDGRIYFTSDRDGTFQIYAIDSTGSGRQLTRTTNGAFDPQWLPEEGGLLLGGFADLSYNVYFARPVEDTTLPPVQLAADREEPEWPWTELTLATADVAPDPYRKKFSLDFAAGDIAVAPGIGSAQGAVFLFSDLIGDHLVYLGLSSFQGNGFTSLVENINGTAFYLNQSRRLNWGVGAFRVAGNFYELDFRSQYREIAWGGFTQLRYPLSRYQRVEGELRLEHSDRQDFFISETDELQRTAWLASNYLSYVKDNTLWLTTGPIDGVRYALTGGLTNDLSHGRFDSWQLWGDLRRYIRTSLRSAVAVRLIGYVSGGERPRRVNLGGTWFLRGYPRNYYVVGSRAYLLNMEWRFPLTNFLSIGFPFGTARFPGVQGALFTDVGRVWTKSTSDRGALGAAGFGFRFPLAAPLVLRLDVGWRYRLGDWSAYGLPPAWRDNNFVDFFFGYNY